ncbi:MAG TPA: hypothetical protein VKM55_30845 [Candidatus Lokiarchaeia archaeon]|nr:hypothetical protein [Candidatus Lokiarchaeia archaeon]
MAKKVSKSGSRNKAKLNKAEIEAKRKALVKEISAKLDHMESIKI